MNLPYPDTYSRHQRYMESPTAYRRAPTPKYSNQPSNYHYDHPANTSQSLTSKSMNLTLTKTPTYQTPTSKDYLRTSAYGAKLEETNYSSKYSKPVRTSVQKPLEVATETDSSAYKGTFYKDFPSHTSTTTNSSTLSSKVGLQLANWRPQSVKSDATRVSNKIESFSTQNSNGLKTQTSHNTPITKSSLLEDSGRVSSSNPVKENKNAYIPMEIKKGYLSSYRESDLPYFDPTKCSSRKNGVVKAYAANTNQGLIRNYNEDRVAIILNIMKPQNVESKEEWPVCSYFGIYDGHGGTACADFLRDNLHQYVKR